MKTGLLSLALFSLLLFVGAGIVLAEDSVNIQVSCTVPAIPGVNSPLLETQNVIAAPAATPAANRQVAMKAQLEQPLLTIQEDSDKEDQKSSEGDKEIVLVKTFYVR